MAVLRSGGEKKESKIRQETTPCFVWQSTMRAFCVGANAMIGLIYTIWDKYCSFKNFSITANICLAEAISVPTLSLCSYHVNRLWCEAFTFPLPSRLLVPCFTTTGSSHHYCSSAAKQKPFARPQKTNKRERKRNQILRRSGGTMKRQRKEIRDPVNETKRKNKTAKKSTTSCTPTQPQPNTTA